MSVDLRSTARQAFSRNEPLRFDEMSAVADNQSWLYGNVRQSACRKFPGVSGVGAIGSGWLGLTKRFDGGGSRAFGLAGAIALPVGQSSGDFAVDFYLADKTTLLVTGQASVIGTGDYTPIDRWAGTDTGIFLFQISPDPGNDPFMLYWELRSTKLPYTTDVFMVLGEPQTLDPTLRPP